MTSVSSVKNFERTFKTYYGSSYKLKISSKKPLQYNFMCYSADKKGRIKDGCGELVEKQDVKEYVKSMIRVIEKIKKVCFDKEMLDDLTNFFIETIK